MKLRGKVEVSRAYPKLLRIPTKIPIRETVNQALFEFIQRRKQGEIAELFGKVAYRPGYDYKADRKRR